MRFFHLVNVRWYNATAWYALNICKLLKAAGHEVVVGVLPNSEPEAKAREMGLDIYADSLISKKPLEILRVANRLGRFLDNYKPDNITSHRGEFFWYLALKRFFGSPSWKLTRVRGDERKPKANFANKFLHNSCTDQLIVSGKVIADHFINNLQTSPDKIKVIYGGVDLKRFAFDQSGREKVRKEFGFDDTDIVVGIVGRYCPVKGHKYLMEAVASLREEDKRYKLLMVTDNGSLDIEELKAKVKNSALDGHAFVTGYRDDVVACMSAIDVGVVASIGSETICRVAFELMAVGVPLVATNIGVLPEVTPIDNLVPAEDSIALAAKIKNHTKELKIFDENEFVKEYLGAI